MVARQARNFVAAMLVAGCLGCSPQMPSNPPKPNAPPPVAPPPAALTEPPVVPPTPAEETEPGEETEARPAENAAASLPVKVNAPHLPNAYRLHAKVISGGLPEGDEAFQELKDLGIKTIISVDGATPDVELAKKFGLRYVHLPHGYDGVPANRASELAKAVRDLPGPIYIHCHHGKHRSPAAATVACIGAGLIAPSAADSILQTAGTNPNYRGLYQSAEKAHPIAAEVLNNLQVEFQEKVAIPPLAEAMVAMEHLHDHLKQMSQIEWQSPPKHPDLTAPHEALLLMEQYKELLRTQEVMNRPADFQQYLREGEQTLTKLHEVLLPAAENKPVDMEQAAALFATASQQCSQCHKQYRDVPLQEKEAAK